MGGAIRAFELEDMETNISRLQNTVAQYIATRPILELCLEAEQRMGLRFTKRRWEKEGLVFSGLWEADEKDGDGEG